MDEDRAVVARCYSLIATAIGDIGLAWSAAGLRFLQLPEADRGATERRLLAGLGPARRAEPRRRSAV